MLRGDGRGSLLYRAALLALSAAFAFTSCGDWVSIGPFIQCGHACEPPPGLQCGQFGAQYSRAGRCVCAEAADCTNYPCQLSHDSGCFVSGFDSTGRCVCVVPLEPGGCGQPCAPAELDPACPSARYEWNTAGECACAPAACPCGQVCPAPPSSDCLILHQYNAHGDCACAPVVCPACADNPCCSALCGSECLIDDCDPETESCEGFCSKTNECVKGTQLCGVPR